MTAREPQEPSEEELVEFVRDLVGGALSELARPEAVRETIADAPELWLTLYRIHHGPPDARGR